jgi:uncharacterized radical SAM protein YgiQ
VISDLGGPTANMYGMHCCAPQMRRTCRRPSCLQPAICKRLLTDHGPLVELMEQSRRLPGVKRVFIASGIRMDLARLSPAYIRELVEHHTGGRLKVAPEHVDRGVLRRMRKPPIEEFLAFGAEFRRAAAAAGKELYLVPYFMAGHPGCDVAAMIDLALFLKRTGYRPEQVQDFIPLPMDPATCMYYTGMDPATGEPVYVPKGGHERRLQRALLQFWKPENYRHVREALEQAGRQDLIGSGPDCLIPVRAREQGSRRTGEQMSRRAGDQEKGRTAGQKGGRTGEQASKRRRRRPRAPGD